MTKLAYLVRRIYSSEVLVLAFSSFFADDTNILYSHKDLDVLTTTINSELAKVQVWFECNKLSLNISKTNFMYFRNAHTPPVNCNIHINGVPLNEKLSTKFLGVTIDANLNWHEHILNITKYFKKSGYLRVSARRVSF